MAEQDRGELKNNNRLYVIIGSIVLVIVLLLLIIFLWPAGPLGKLTEKDVEKIVKEVPPRYSFIEEAISKDAKPAEDKDEKKEPVKLDHVEVFKAIKATMDQFKKGDEDVNRPAMMVYNSLMATSSTIDSNFADAISDSVIKARSILFEDSKVKVEDIISIIKTPYQEIRSKYEKEIAEIIKKKEEDAVKKGASAENETPEDVEIQEENNRMSELYAKVMIKYLFSPTGLVEDSKFFEDAAFGYNKAKYFESVLNNMSSEMKSVSESKLAVDYKGAKPMPMPVINYIFVTISQMAKMILDEKPVVTIPIINTIISSNPVDTPVDKAIQSIKTTMNTTSSNKRNA
ncbi:hypothetical protein HK407_01g02410 [Ordospora pajunii]|uniref:uncharacterized protein n=1 Tax=Ordospora pajunii TaxID=3039483 RepID=UPI0029527A94|nr:uncharacterized protein HK407_01g02410 [Ordospora pajunii]KAH9412346.1 hypothetical protein HK407_01g02410 [Ordospora pajunii]